MCASGQDGGERIGERPRRRRPRRGQHRRRERDHGRRRLGGRRRPDIAAEAPAPNTARHLVDRRRRRTDAHPPPSRATPRTRTRRRRLPRPAGPRAPPATDSAASRPRCRRRSSREPDRSLSSHSISVFGKAACTRRAKPGKFAAWRSVQTTMETASSMPGLGWRGARSRLTGRRHAGHRRRRRPRAIRWRPHVLPAARRAPRRAAAPVEPVRRSPRHPCRQRLPDCTPGGAGSRS